MKVWWFILFLAFSPFEGLQRIALRNQYAQQAQAAYQKEEYQQAAFLYERVRQNEGGKPHPSILMNLAHAYFHQRLFTKASPLYRALLKNSDPSQLSTVATQLSYIEAEEGNYTKALSYAKQAIIADETNQAARYNYELLQKYLILHPEKKQGPPPPQPADNKKGSGGRRQPTPGGTPAEGGSAPNQAGSLNQSAGAGTNPQAGKNGTPEEQPTGSTPGPQQGLSSLNSQTSNRSATHQGADQENLQNQALLQTRFERLKKLQLSPEKARQLLDAMRQEEAQYLQQVPRKRSTQRDKNSPDW
ncbi:tetratricopeptide repeat protein [Rufibacter glacialis]|uniref:Tetratricopeptide repeat protein n=1 Tax=Rufibacter glacialis TaxID=1259555 RepID=A0A5M8Q9B2_9BACT|nr:tetratricopeptide repeat protein [Rufibacter glacialis]KAA6431681.1 hypothetical protein FOE74_16285 [Rufibacter glacialis]GGK82477.1 hypothetical protein GCM10011405_32800 [Rufibacter glacialis]